MKNGIVFEYNKLRGRMAEKGLNQKMLASKIQVHENTLSNKMYSISYFDSAEIRLICKALDIPESQIPEYFFSTF